MPPPSLSLTTLLNAFREDVDEPVAAVLLYERQIPADGKDKGTSFSLPTSILLSSHLGPKLTVALDETTKTLLYIDGDNGDEEDLEIHMGLTEEYASVSNLLPSFSLFVQIPQNQVHHPISRLSRLRPPSICSRIAS